MKWKKRGLVFNPRGMFSWAEDTALTPTPLLVDEETIRIYAGFRTVRERAASDLSISMPPIP